MENCPTDQMTYSEDDVSLSRTLSSSSEIKTRRLVSLGVTFYPYYGHDGGDAEVMQK